jgi:hypothetical protein
MAEPIVYAINNLSDQTWPGLLLVGFNGQHHLLRRHGELAVKAKTRATRHIDKGGYS